MPKVSKLSSKKETVVEEDKIVMAIIPTATVHFSAEFAPGKFVTYSRFNEQDLIHIREYIAMGGRTYPSKRGACFTPARLKALMNKFEEIDEQLKQLNSDASYKVVQTKYMAHFGAGIYVAQKYKGVNLRRYW